MSKVFRDFEKNTYMKIAGIVSIIGIVITIAIFGIIFTANPNSDVAEVENGKIQKESIIDYIINKNGSDIREIIIKNYRQKERVNELINTAGWSLTRMLENINK